MTGSESPRQRFTDAYDAYADAIFRHCYLRVGDRNLAIDILQDTFMKTWEYIAGGNEIENLRAFLYRTANNLIIDGARRAKRRPTDSLEDLEENGFDPEGEDGRSFAKDMDERQVVETISRLEEPYRTVVVMRYVDEMQPREIAEALDESPNVISVRINRGLKQLRALLPQYE